uniref:Protein kinase domain-containing protein n=2 Tax=Mesocestoides corti TaxID=53468 RepID=A0A5K3F2Y4_MESCO
MQNSFRTRSLPSLVQQNQQPRLTPNINLTEDLTRRFTLEPSQNINESLNMASLEEIFHRTNQLIDALLMGEQNREKNVKFLKQFEDMTDCQQQKIQYAKSVLQFSMDLDALRMEVTASTPQAFSTRRSLNENNDWDCVDAATCFYNAICADQVKFQKWLSEIDSRFPFRSTTEISEEDRSSFAEVLCNFESDQGVINNHEIVKILETESGNALVIGRGYITDKHGGPDFGLYTALKASIERHHRLSDALDRTCESCRIKPPVKSEPAISKISHQVRTWIPMIYLQPFNLKTRLLKQAAITRNFVLSVWDSYVKEAGQAIVDLFYTMFARWNRDKVDADYATVSADIRTSLQAFFKSLEESLTDDWECGMHYDLILKQLRLLQSNDNFVQDTSQTEPSNQEITKRVGQLLLERRVIFQLLEKYQEMMQFLKVAKQESVQPPQVGNCIDPPQECFGQRLEFKLATKDTETASTPNPSEEYNPLSQKSEATFEKETNDLNSKDSLNDASIPSPPPPFGRGAPSCQEEPCVVKKTPAKLVKQYDSEPCIIEATGELQQQAHAGRYKSVDLSLKGIDKCSRFRARSFGQGSKSLPRTAYPLSVMRSPPMNVSSISSAFKTRNYQIGYVIIMRPSFRERITTVLDTRRRKRVSIHVAIERGVAGFEGGDADERHLSEEEQKQAFFVYDTALGKKLNYLEAIKAGIIHYDSSAKESIVFDEYAKSEWRGVKSIYHPLVYRVEQVREVVERDGKLIRQKHKFMSFEKAVTLGIIDKKTAEFVIHTNGEEVQRLPFVKALAYGLVKVVVLRHCLIEKLPRENCIFA